MIRVGKTRNLLRASSSPLEIWTRSAHHHPGQRRHVSRTIRPDKSTHSITSPEDQNFLANRAASTKEGWTSGSSPPPLAHCKPENRSLAGPFSLCAKGVCRSHPPFGDWPPARDRSPNAHRLFPPAPRSRRGGFKISIYFNELTGSRCACVSLVPACLKAGGDATRAAWSLVCLGSLARSFRGTVEIEKIRGQPAWWGLARDQGRLLRQALSRLLRDHEPSPRICFFGIPLKPCKDVPRVLYRNRCIAGDAEPCHAFKIARSQHRSFQVCPDRKDRHGIWKE